jgi:RNA polymerase sigma factor (sigma-70 family)
MGESWTTPLRDGDPEAAWDQFIERYRRLIFATIRHYTVDRDDVMDAFARVCEAVRENNFARLRRYAAHIDPDRPFSTWLVVVVRNLVIDWLRHRNGRPRLSAMAAALPPLRQRIFAYVFLEGRSHVEAFELLHTRDGSQLSFGDYLKELAATYRTTTGGSRGRLVAQLAGPPPPLGDQDPTLDDPAVLAEQSALLAEVLGSLPADDQLAVQLYVVTGMPAEQVARALGYPSAKTVYNRVYRALALIRAHFAEGSVRRNDL